MGEDAKDSVGGRVRKQENGFPAFFLSHEVEIGGCVLRVKMYVLRVTEVQKPGDGMEAP